MTEPAAALAVPAPTNAIRSRLAVLLGSHTLVDVYAAFVPPLLGILEVRCHLEAAQTAWILGIGSVSSGLSQPLSAWLSDRTDSRIYGAAGLALAAICLSCIGVARDFQTLALLYTLGMIGVGVYHPVAAASVGQLAVQLGGSRRSLGVSLFFVAGMAGGMSGSLLSPWITAQDGGFETLRYLMIPGLLAAAVLQVAVGRVPHRHHDHRRLAANGADAGWRWRTVALLYVSNAMRFTVNMALLYLFVRWAQHPFALAWPEWTGQQVAVAAAPINGRLNALLVLGMAIGGLTAGSLVRAGREKWPLVITPVALCPAIAFFPGASVATGSVLAVLAGIGFAAMIPVTISLSQRLLPHRTSLASGLMLGGAWMLAVAGPALAELAEQRLGLGPAFLCTAALLALAGLVCLPLSAQSIQCASS